LPNRLHQHCPRWAIWSAKGSVEELVPNAAISQPKPEVFADSMHSSGLAAAPKKISPAVLVLAGSQSQLAQTLFCSPQVKQLVV